MAIEHFNDSCAWDIAMLRWALELEIAAEEQEMAAVLATQVEAAKTAAGKIVL